MKAYRDILGKPLPKTHVMLAVILIIKQKQADIALIVDRYSWGYGKALRIMELLQDAGVVSSVRGGRRTIILKNGNEAVNAALRQLRKGKP